MNLSKRSSMRIRLVPPAGKVVRMTPEHPAVPRSAMLRFSVLPLTTVAALTLSQDEKDAFRSSIAGI